MDGDRIRLRNGVGALDASSLSYDHAVPEDPNSVERLEVVRGPAALLYGGNAIGGVVNSFDNRIPSEPVDGIHGSGELRYGGADTTRSRSGALEAGDGNFALHVDAASREFNDVRIPGYAHSSRQRQIDGDTGKHRVQNSDGRQDGGAVGGSYHWEHGYAGLSYSGYDSNYGSPAEDDVRLKMQQDRYAFASEIRDLEGPFTSLKLDAAYTKYEHKEIEDGETGTTFKNEGYEGRIEARHRPLGPLNGVVGAQFANSRFSALGEEAFVPHGNRQRRAVRPGGMEAQRPPRPQLRRPPEHTRVDPDAKGNERFAENDGSQSFTTGSLSTGAVYKLTPTWSLAATLSYTERAPTFYELYANGPHAATGTYEVGDADADKERRSPPTSPCASTTACTRAASGCSTAASPTTSACSPAVAIATRKAKWSPPAMTRRCRNTSTAAFARTSTASRRRTASTCWKARTATSTWNSPGTTPAPRTRTPANRCHASPRCA